MTPEWWTALAVFVVALAAEVLHARRVAAVAPLLLGRSHRFTVLAKASPWIRAAALAAVAWAATVLLMTEPQRWNGDVTADQALATTDLGRLVVLLDVSPSMALPDAGGTKQTRSARAAAVLDNVMDRVDLRQTRVSVVPFYTTARPVIVDAVDPALVHAMALESTLDVAFDDGDTDLNASVNAAAELTRDWRAGSATLLILTDGDSVSQTPVNDLPAAVNRVLVAGIGDSVNGTFIDGHVSRQDADNLRQLALRLRGTYVDTDEHFLPSTGVDAVGGVLARTVMPPPGRREIALALFAVGAAALAVLPFLLSGFGMASRLTAVRRAASLPTRVGSPQ